MKLRALEKRLEYVNMRLRHENVRSSDPNLQLDEEFYQSYLEEKEEIERILSRAEDQD